MLVSADDFKADPAKFPDYAGVYELSLDSPRRTTITSEGAKLFMERMDARKVQLFPESNDLFFRKGVEGRILFRFRVDEKVDALIDRRNNEEPKGGPWCEDRQSTWDEPSNIRGQCPPVRAHPSSRRSPGRRCDPDDGVGR